MKSLVCWSVLSGHGSTSNTLVGDVLIKENIRYAGYIRTRASMRPSWEITLSIRSTTTSGTSWVWIGLLTQAYQIAIYLAMLPRCLLMIINRRVKMRLKAIERRIPPGSLSYLTFTFSPHISLFSLDSLRPNDQRQHLLIPAVNHKKSSLIFSPNPDLGNCHCEGTEAISPFSMRLPPTFLVPARG